MRPCDECGHPLQNHQKVCDLCNREQVLNLGVRKRDNDTALPPTMGVRLAHVAWTVTELLLRTLIVGVPLSAVLSLVSFFIVWNRTALLVGTIAGTVLALAYSLIEMYFQDQVFRGPLE